MSYGCLPFVTLLMAAAALSASLSIYAWRRRRRVPGGLAFGLFMLAIAHWSFFYAVELLPLSLEARLFWAKVQYLGIASAPLLWLIFALSHTGRGHVLTPRNLVLLSLPPVVAILTVWSNEVHRLWWPDYHLDSSGLFPILALDHGPAFWLFIIIAYVYILAGMVLYVSHFRHAPRPFHLQISLILLAVLVWMLGSIADMAPLPPGWDILDFTPFTFVISGLLLAYGAFRRQLLDIMPVARQVVVERMLDGVIVLDTRGCILDINPAAREMVGMTRPDPVGRPLSEVLPQELSEGLEPILAADFRQIQESELRYPWAQEERIISVTASPVEDEQGQLLGRLLVLRDVTQQRQAEEAIRRRAQELSALQGLASVVSQSLDLDQVLSQAMEHTLALLEADRGAIFLLDREKDVLSCAYAHGLSQEYIAFINAHYRQTPGSRLLQSPEPVHIPDAQTDPAAAFIRDMAIREGYHTLLILQLGYQEEPIGALALYRDQIRPFSARSVALGQAIAHHISTAIENARLYREERTGRRIANTLQEVSRIIGSTLELDEVLRLILEQLEKVLDFQAAVLLLVDEERNELYVREWRGYPEDAERLRLPLDGDKGITVHVARTGQPIYVPDVSQDERYISGGFEGGSELAVPLKIKDKVIGVLNVESRERYAFDEEDLQLLVAFAAQAAMAIENARLFEEMKRLKAFSEDIVEGVAEAILIEDPDGFITFANRAAEELLGYSREELIGLHWKAIVPEEEHERVSREMAKRPRGIASRYETTLLSKDGRVIPTIVGAKPLFENGRFVGVLAAFTDISERVRAEREIEERRHYLERVLAAAPDAIVTLDAQHRIVEWNPGAERLFGYSREEVIGRDLDPLITNPDVYEEAVGLTQVILEGGEVLPMETVRYRKDGSPVDVIVAGSPILVGDELVGIVAVYTDITERKRAEELLRALNAAAVAVQRAARTPEAVFAAVTEQLQALGFSGAVFLLDDTRERLIIRHAAVAPSLLARVEEMTGLKAEGYTFSLDQLPIVRQILDGETVFVSDVAAVLTPIVPAPIRPLLATILRLVKSPRAIAAPLSVGGEVIGFLSVSAGHLTEADIPAVTAFANQMSAALENAQLYEATEKRWQEAETLRQASAAVVETLSLDETLDRILEQLERVVPYDSASVQLLRDGYLEIVGGRGFPELEAVIGLKFPVPDDNPNTEVIEKRRPVILADAPAAHASFRQPPHDHIRSWLGVPLMVRERVIGMLAVDSVEPNHFTDEHIRLVIPFAGQVAVAIENARLYEESHRRLRQMQSLLEIGRDITSTLELDQVLHRIMETAVAAIGPAEKGTLHLLDEERGELVVRASVGFSPETIAAAHFKPGEGYTGWVFAHQQPLIIGNVKTDPRTKPIDLPEVHEEKSALCVPLIVRDRAIGTLTLDNVSRYEAFTSEHLDLLTIFANQAVVAIENARLFEETKRYTDRLTTLYETGRDITSILELDELLQLLVDRAACLTGADKSLILLLDDEAREVIKAVGRGFAPGQVDSITYQEVQDGISGWVLREGKPTISEDLLTDPRNTGLALEAVRRERERGQSAAVAPLFIKDRPIGTMTVVNNVGKPVFSQDDLDMVAMLASQAAIAIENARLYEETRRRLVREERLNELAHTLGGEMELASLIPRLLPTVVELTGADAGTVALFDPERQEVTYPYHHNLPGWLTRAAVPANTGLVGYTMQERRTVRLDDYREHPEALQPWVEAGVRSLLSVPLLAGEEVMGALGLFSLGEVRPFDAEAVAAAEAAARLAAVAIQRARLYEETRQRAAELSILYEAATAAMTSVRLEEVLDRTIAVLQEKLPADSIAILLVEPETEELVIRASAGFPGGPKLVRRPIGVGIPGWVVQTGQPALVADVRKDERYQECDPDTRSELCVPLRVGERIIGALNLESRRVGAFDEEDLRLLSILAGHLAVVIENARLVEGLEAEVAARTAEIRAEKEKSETILRNVGEAIIMTDRENRIQYVNPAFTVLTGYTEEEVIGRCVDIMHEGAMTEVSQQALLRSLARGETWQGELIARRKDGRFYDAALTIAPMRDAEGKVIGYVSSLRDITQLKELERARSKFMANVSHELRTPVANMKLYTQLLRKARRPEKTKRYLQVIEQQVDRLAHLIEDILEMMSLDSGQAVSTWAPVRLSSVIGNVVARYQNQAEAAGLTLVAEPLPPDLPEVRGDGARLVQALGELVENAVTFTPRGGRVTIETEAVEEGGRRWVTIAVRDTGPGIEPEEQERIFERFYRGKLAEAGHIPGTGLGLSIVQEIMRAHGGRVTVESELGKGSTFTLWLHSPT